MFNTGKRKIPHNRKPNRDLSEYAVGFPSFRLPRKIGHFSTDENNSFTVDDSQKSYLRIDHVRDCLEHLQIPMDVTCHDDRHVPFDHHARFKPNILPWMRQAKENIWDHEENRLKYDFVMTAGRLNEIFLAPYNMQHPTIIFVYKFNETFYVWTEDRDLLPEATQSIAVAKAGHVFELHVRSPTPDGDPDPYGIANENKQYYHVNETKIKNHRILYSVNVDCVEIVQDKATGEQKEEAIEVCVTVGTPSRINTFNFKRYKLLNYWVKGFIGGFERIVCGFRDSAYVVNSIKIFETSKLPDFIKTPTQRPMWTLNVCTNFALQMFDFIKVSCNKESYLYTVTYTIEGELKCEERKIAREELEYPEWFYNEFK